MLLLRVPSTRTVPEVVSVYLRGFTVVGACAGLGVGALLDDRLVFGLAGAATGEEGEGEVGCGRRLGFPPGRRACGLAPVG
jgi:hypothetical protein